MHKINWMITFNLRYPNHLFRHGKLLDRQRLPVHVVSPALKKVAQPVWPFDRVRSGRRVFRLPIMRTVVFVRNWSSQAFDQSPLAYTLITYLTWCVSCCIHNYIDLIWFLATRTQHVLKPFAHILVCDQCGTNISILKTSTSAQKLNYEQLMRHSPKRLYKLSIFAP